MSWCFGLCGASFSSVIHPVDTNPVQDCPICLEKISVDQLMHCSNPTHPHSHHVGCVTNYCSQISTGIPTPCSMKCGYVFQNVLGTKSDQNEITDLVPEVELNWDDLQPRIDAAMLSGSLRLSRRSRRDLLARDPSEED